MGYVSRHVSYKDFMWLFNLFGDDVRAGYRKSIPYNEYRPLKKALEAMGDKDDNYIMDMIVDYNTKTHEVVVFTDNDIFHFSVDGNSFGAYLFDELHFLDDLYEKETWENIEKRKDAYGIAGVSSLCYPAKNYKLDIADNKKVMEDNAMKFNFDFGPVSGNAVRMSMYGLAVKNKSGTWVSYDAKSGDVMDVDVFNFDGAKFLYKMPVAIKDISVGDVIVHHNAPMFVVGVPADGKAVIAVDPIAGERKEIMLTKSPFGFNFVTKVINFLGDTLSGGASAENPFGNLGLMMMLSEDGNGVKDMLPLMLMANGGSVDMSNPLMLYALMGSDGKMGDMLPFLFMMNANKPAAPAHECKCGGHCGEN